MLSLGSVSSDAIFALGGDDLVLAFNGNDIVLSGLSALGIKARAVETRVLDDGNGASLTRDSLKDMLAAELGQTGQTADFWGLSDRCRHDPGGGMGLPPDLLSIPRDLSVLQRVQSLQGLGAAAGAGQSRIKGAAHGLRPPGQNRPRHPVSQLSGEPIIFGHRVFRTALAAQAGLSTISGHEVVLKPPGQILFGSVVTLYHNISQP